MRPRALIRIESRHCTWISGSYGVGDELASLDSSGRRPVWSSRQRAFCVSEQTAKRAIAALEHAGWDLVVEGPRAARSLQPASLPSQDESPDPGQGLW